MPIKVACACGKKLAVKDELAGKKVKCPACQKLLSIPKPKVQEDEWDLGDSAEEDFEDEPSDAPMKSRGGKSSASRGAVSRKSSVKGKGKKSKSSNRGLLIGLSAGGGVLVVALLAWMLWPAAPVAKVADNPPANQEQTPAPASGDAAKGSNAAEVAQSTQANAATPNNPVNGGGISNVNGSAPPLMAKQRQEEIQQSRDKLKSIALALSKNLPTEFVKKAYPAGYSDQDGKLILSWRVAILPALGEEELWKQFRLDQPWDSEHNRKLIPKMPAVFKAVRGESKEGHTYYRGFAGEDAMFPLKSPTAEKVSAGDRSYFPVYCRPLGKILDGTSNTFLIAEAGETVPWTKPEELTFDAKQPLPKLGGQFDGDFVAMISDGTTRLMTRLIPEPALRAAITAARGENIQFKAAAESGFTIEFVTPEMEERKYALGNQAAKSPHASMTQITDATSETALAGIVAEGRAVPWTKPDDLIFDDTFQTKENAFAEGAIMFANGSVRYVHLQAGLDRQQFRALFTIAGKEPSPLTSLYPPGHTLIQPTYATVQETVRQSEARSQNLKNLKEMALAFHNYQQTHQNLPPAIVYGPDGKPWHSWRVLILPFLGQGALYQEYDGTVPWDHPKNAAVLNKMPKVYRDPLSNDSQGTLTPYLVITGPGTGFPTGNATREVPRPANSAPNSTALAGTNPATAKASANPPASDVTGDLKALQGDWHVVEMQTDPPRPPKELEAYKALTISFVGDSMKFDNPHVSVPQPPQAIKLDSSQTPNVIDVMPPPGNANVKQLLGIYSLEKDVLKLFLSPLSRPTSFTPIKGQREGILILHRGKAKVPTGDALPKNAFDQVAWKQVEPQLKAKGLTTQLTSLRGEPDEQPDTPSSCALVDLPATLASAGIPDDLKPLLARVSHLSIRCKSLSDVGLKQLTELPGLMAVGFDESWSVTPQGLLELMKCRKLRGLYFLRVPLTLQHMQTLKELTAVRSLTVSQTPLTSEMTAGIAEMKLLLVLNTYKSGLNDEGLAQIAKLTQLKSLMLDGNPITDQGLQHVKKLKDLQFLYLREVNLSPQAVDELQKALPGCKILK